MTKGVTSGKRTARQGKEQKPQFLAYQYVDVNFIYSFTWDATMVTWETLCNELESAKGRGWKRRPLHERVINDGMPINCNYQPNLVFKTQVLERTAQILKDGTLLLPLNLDHYGNPSEFEEIPIDLRYTVRLFDNGGATCTFNVCLRDSNASFRNIHAVLHLVQNLDPENHASPPRQCLTIPIIQTFFLVPKVVARNTDLDYSLFREDKPYCTLHDLIRILLSDPPHWAPNKAKKLWTESDIVPTKPNQGQDFQSPFVFTIAQIESSSLLSFLECPTPNSNREVASILCRLTLDNRYIEKDYMNLSENYMRYMLRYDATRIGLANVCLDSRLFFTMSRRGAIALTSDINGIPSYFVVPSLLNLYEIIRTRWHTSNIVSARLDEIISQIGNTPNLNPLHLMEDMFKWRMMFAAFLRDPVPFLFDGGSVTEIAEIAETQLWLQRLRDETARKFALLDDLVRDYLNIQRLRDYNQH